MIDSVGRFSSTGLAISIAKGVCEHLLHRSEHLALSALRHMDLDQDGAVSQEEFLKTCPHVLGLVIESAALAAAFDAILKDASFQDDFHASLMSPP
eukprot:4783842-Amphidinium_carterae.2